MKSVSICKFLSDKELAADEEWEWLAGNNWECRSVLRIQYPGEEDYRDHIDGGEPEDSSFGRDWGWVAGEIQRAFDKGVEYGKKSM